LFVPSHIKKPDYYQSGIPSEEINSKYNSKIVEVKSFEDIEKMRKVCLLGRYLFSKLIKPLLNMKLSE